ADGSSSSTDRGKTSTTSEDSKLQVGSEISDASWKSPRRSIIDRHVSFTLETPLQAADIALVQRTWGIAMNIGAEALGWMLFMNLFKLDPQTRELFHFDDALDPASSKKLKLHACRVISTLDMSIRRLADAELWPVLQELGLKHVGYNVTPEHYVLMSEALIKSLGVVLGCQGMTPEVTNAWSNILLYLKKCMGGSNLRMPKMRTKEEKAAGPRKAVLRSRALDAAGSYRSEDSIDCSDDVRIISSFEL
ncbi:unnamed protein product, partial [Polarella glacialis]